MMSKILNSKFDKDIIRGKPLNISENELTSELQKFNKTMISSMIEASSNKKQTFLKDKKILIKEAINLLTEKFSDLDELILYLRLKYIHCQKGKRIWRVLQLKNARRLMKPALTSKEVSHSIFKYCKKNNVFCKVISEREGHCISSVLFFDDGCPQKPTYVVTNMKLSLVLIHNLRQNYRLTFEKVIKKVYKASDIEELPDIRANIEYLQKIYRTLPQSFCKSSENKIQALEKEQIIQAKTKIVENNKAKEIKAKAVLEEEDEESRTNAVAEKKVERTKAKQKKFEKASTSAIGKDKNRVNKDITRGKVHTSKCQIARINNEALYDKRKNRRGDQNTFEKHELPTITNLKYCVKSNSFGAKENVNSVCVVEFQGTNILKGLEKLVEYGMADNPLPKYLCNEPRSGKTNYMIAL